MGPQHLRGLFPVAPSIHSLPTSARIGIGVGAGLVAIFGVAYVGGHFLAGDKLPTKASVAGVPVGGLIPSAAEQKLRAELADRAAQSLTITAETQTLSVAPSVAGLGVDYPASVAQSGGGGVGTWNPAVILTVIFGGSELPAVVAVDQAKLDATLATLAEKVDIKAVNAEVTYDDLLPVRSVGKDGVALDRMATTVAVKAAYLSSTAIAATVGTVEPEVTTAEADQAVAGIAATAVSGPVKVAVGNEGTIAL
ncbi:MAG: peptidoglycan binding domain-containing protein, partial [Umezawaea sp.]